MKDCLLLYGPVFVDIGPFCRPVYFFVSLQHHRPRNCSAGPFVLLPPGPCSYRSFISLPCNFIALSLHPFAFAIVINKLREIGEYEGNSSYVRCIVVNLFYCWKLLK